MIPLPCSKVSKALCKYHLATMQMLQGKAVGKSTLPVSEIILETADCCTWVRESRSCTGRFSSHPYTTVEIHGIVLNAIEYNLNI